MTEKEDLLQAAFAFIEELIDGYAWVGTGDLRSAAREEREARARLARLKRDAGLA